MLFSEEMRKRVGRGIHPLIVVVLGFLTVCGVSWRWGLVVRSQNYSQSAVQISTTLPVDSFLYRLGPLSNRTRGCYNMAHITDDYIREMLQNSKPYTLVILRKTPKSEERGADKIVWEHGRRNFELRRDGKLCVACPVRDESDVSGIGIFSTDVNATREIMDEDPGVKAGIFVYEVHATRSFPGDALAK